MEIAMPKTTFFVLHCIMIKMKWNNQCNFKKVHVHLTNVLFSVRTLTPNWSWVSSFMISSRQKAVFFWQSIGAALVDGINWEFRKSAKSSRAEPEEKKSLSSVKPFQLRYFMISATSAFDSEIAQSKKTKSCAFITLTCFSSLFSHSRCFFKEPYFWRRFAPSVFYFVFWWSKQKLLFSASSFSMTFSRLESVSKLRVIF